MGEEIFVSTNYNSSHPTEQYVTDLYEAFLQRAPDGPGLTFWVNNTNANGLAATLAAFKVSGEYAELAGTLYREAFWLVPDHLGTPRMIVNKSGSLASIKRHDYLPFGEELSGRGSRTAAMGYTVDSVRQRFTSKERDGETGLDYFGARYYTNVQGRFTGVDPYDINLERQNTADPEEAEAVFRNYISEAQHWNRYSYALNNPLKYVDPNGREEFETHTIPFLGEKLTIKISKNIGEKDRADILNRIRLAVDKINSGQLPNPKLAKQY
jgi:RHS repeat-associated protein